MTYVDSTSKQAEISISQHIGIPFRTGNGLANPPHSSPRIHSHENNHILRCSEFNILNCVNNESDNCILKSLFCLFQR